MNYAEVEQMELSVLHTWLRNINDERIYGDKKELVNQLVNSILHKLNALLQLNVDYLSLCRSIPSLSGGERQRVRIASQLTCSLKGLIYILDEPCKGLHYKDTNSIIKATRDLVKKENTKEIVGFCRDSKVKYLVFTGGEPLLYPNLVDVVRYIKASTPSISVAIPTNGVLLKDLDYCKKLIESGVEYFDISIKGKNSDEWYKATGYDGSTSQLIAIHNLSTLPVEFTCSMVITPENVHTFCDSIRLASDNGAKQFSFTFLIDNTDAEEKGEEYLEKHNPFTLIAAFVSQIKKINAITEEWWIEYSFPLCVYSKEQLILLEGKLASPCQIHMRNAVTFNTRMELLPCDMYIQQSIGKLGEDFLSYNDYIEFSENPLFRNIMDPLRRLPSSNCKSCEYLESCYGGCPVLWKKYSYDELMVFKTRSHA